MNPSREKSLYFRDQLREARAVALRDAEGYQGILFAIERLGYFLSEDRETRNNQNLGAYKEPICDLVRESSWHVQFEALYDLVRESRNDALHQGAVARHLTHNAIEVALVIENALMSGETKAGSYMVRTPVCAELWQPLSFLRQQMLANSFTYVPILREMEWWLVSDYHLARYLRSGCRRHRLAETVEDALRDGEHHLTVESAITCNKDATVSEVLKKSNGRTVLVVDSDHKDRLLGIITPFDVL